MKPYFEFRGKDCQPANKFTPLFIKKRMKDGG